MRSLMLSTSMIGMAILAAASALPASAAPQYYGSSGDTIRCESNDGRTRECATNGGRVVLERQISSTACIEGRSWGYSRNGIYVSQGCRADFRVVNNDSGNYGSNYGSDSYGGNYGGNYGSNYGSGYGNSGTFRCESSNNRTERCAVQTGGRVQLVRQLSSSACIEGRTWGQDRNAVWVSQGCRAEFRGDNGYYGNQGNGNGYGYGNGIGQMIRCESVNDRTQRCAVDTRGGVQLVRKLSSSACIEGRSWNYDRSGIWVSQGCRAEFSIGNRGYGNSGNYGNSYGNNYGIGGQVFRCESNDGRTRECATNTRAGVQLVRQLSSAACIQGRTWGYGQNRIWVSQGCRAEFRSY
ncbi:MAG: DUF3011 domain-containing protein [Thermomonas sp.]